MIVDIVPEGTPRGAEFLAFRADIDALPIDDAKADVPYRSTVPGRAHACGHDVHTSVVLGTALVLAEAARTGELRRPVRLFFQPAEEVMPGGALDVIDAGGMDGVGRIFAVHCDPRVEVGRVGLRAGAITSACDRLVLHLDGPGGHTARPHLTTDLVTAIARMAADLPAVLARRMDPRWGVSLVWGRIAAGSAPNVIPQHAELEGTVRCLELAGWREAPDQLHELIAKLAETYRAKWTLDYHRGVPPVVNEAVSVALLEAAMTARFGGDGREVVEDTEQSLGGEDFSWYLEHAPGALARLGVRPPGTPRCATCTRAASTWTSGRSGSAWSSSRPWRWTRGRGPSRRGRSPVRDARIGGNPVFLPGCVNWAGPVAVTVRARQRSVGRAVRPRFDNNPNAPAARNTTVFYARYGGVRPR